MGGSNLMSAIAGRVLLIPRGNYDSTATYTMLDMVVYNGSSYICKQECTGVVPTNTTYWMLNASGSAVAYINDIGDVVITNPTNGQVLMYDSTTQKWVNGTITTTLAGLTDTQIASLQNGQVLKYNSTSQKWENADEKGGILPHLIVISETGSTVTATKGTTVITATETSTGHFECDLPEFGTWTIDAILSGDDAQVSLVVDTVKVYTVDDSHFHADITVKYPSGATCNLAGQGESYYATGSPYTFTVHHAGNYTITVTYNGQTYTDTVTVTTTGQTFSKKVPTPSSAPANDIDWWLWFGGVSGSYSSLSDILADSTALSILMASTDAVDYLVRCNEFITASGQIPVMTSNTAPSGVVSASSEYSAAYGAYKAFNGDDSSNGWASSSNPSWVQYQFADDGIIAKKVKLYHHYSGATGINLVWNVLGSNNGTDFETLATNLTIVNGDTEYLFSLDNNTRYKYYKFECTSGDQGAGTGTHIQIYQSSYSECVCDNQSAMSYIGLNNYCANTLLADSDWLDGIANSEYFESVLTTHIPTMTSDTTPSGEVSCSTAYSTTNGWYAFDKNLSTQYISNGTGNDLYVQYKFPSNIHAYKLYIALSSSTTTSYTLTYKIQGSNDGNTWDDIVDNQTVTVVSGTNTIANHVIDEQYTYFRLVKVTAQSSMRFVVPEFDVYGREDV